MKNSDKQNARIESERALQQVIFSIMADNMELFKQFQDNPDFKKWLSDLVFNLTYNKEGKPYQTPSKVFWKVWLNTTQRSFPKRFAGAWRSMLKSVWPMAAILVWVIRWIPNVGTMWMRKKQRLSGRFLNGMLVEKQLQTLSVI